MTPDDDLTHTTPPDATRDQSEAALDAGLAAAFGDDDTHDARPLGAAGEVIGERYRLIDEVGVGGMGSVWRAEQRTPVKRYVAVKLVKPGMDSKAVLARFDAERQALAVMDHPNIARVFDGGIWSPSPPAGEGLGVRGSIPYFVMELIKGVPITEFCDARKLTPRQRLELFVPVCSAIQHAHMKGVIHRDIKPSNVLVALYDDKAVPKVIDFGVAKATGAALTEHTLHTGLGAVVGTPEYMSPEQASLNNLDIDTRSDVYALGVLLYELLAGSPPFTRQELEVKGLLELLRVVREVEPPRPSVKLSTASAKPSIAANRGTEPGPLAKLLRSELDWLVMKALEKDRNRRYDSANGFAADVNRYLAGEAVQAVPPSLGYRVRKWVWKNRGLVTTSGLVAASLLAGTGVATWQAIRADQEADRARQEEAKTKDALAQSEKNREQAESNLVQGYLRPIGAARPWFGVSQAELFALDELARVDDDHIKLRFLREALADGDRASRVVRRAERVIQAAVASSPRRREAAIALVSEKQRDADADPRVRLAACWLAIELGSDDLPALGEAFDTLSTLKAEDPEDLVSRLPAQISPAKRSDLARALARAIGKTTNEQTAGRMASAISDLAHRLEPAEAKRAFEDVSDGVRTASDHGLLEAAALALPAVAPEGVGEAEYARIVELLGKRIVSAPDGRALTAPLRVLSGLAPLLDTKAAGQLTDVLILVLRRATAGNQLSVAAKGIVVLAPRLGPAAAVRGFDLLVGLDGTASDPHSPHVADALVALASHLGSAASHPHLAKTAAALAAVFGEAAGRDALVTAGNKLTALAPSLDAATAGRTVHTLIAALGRVTELEQAWPFAQPLSALAPRLSPAAANHAADVLAGLVRKKRRVGVGAAPDALAALAPQLDRATAAECFDALVGALDEPANWEDLPSVGLGLVPLAARLDPSEWGRRCDTLAKLVITARQDYIRSAAGEGLLAVLSQLDPAAARDKLDRTGRALFEALGNADDFTPITKLAALQVQVDPTSAERCGDTLVAVLGKAEHAATLSAAARGLVDLTRRLDEAVALAKLTAATDALLGSPTLAVGWDEPWPGTDALARLAGHLDRGTAQAKLARAADALIALLDKAARIADHDRRRVIGHELVHLAPHLDSRAVSKGFDALTELLEAANDNETAWGATDALAGLVPQFDRHRRAVRSLEALRLITRAERRKEASTYSYFAVNSLLSHIDTFPPLGDLLRDPGCVGSLQSLVLARLEQLAYPEPTQAAVFAGLAADPLRVVTLPALQLADDHHRKLNRRFRTVSDAAKWLAEHHPEIDLDTPYHKASPAK